MTISIDRRARHAVLRLVALGWSDDSIKACIMARFIRARREGARRRLDAMLVEHFRLAWVHEIT